MTNKELELIRQLTEVVMTAAELKAENKIQKDINEKLMQALRIHDVVGRSEQFYCNCSRAKGLDYDEDGMPYCIECQKPVQ